MSIYDGVSRANDSLDKLSGLLSSKREFIIKQTANSVLLFIILLVFGCLDFATLTFHGEYLLTASYWGTIGTKMVAAICALNIGINMMLENEIKKSEELSRNINEYNKLIALKDTDFEYFVTKVFNPQLKRKAYLFLMHRKIYLLNKFSRRKDRLLYSSELPENQEKKLKNRYCRTRKELEDLMTDDYINKNIDTLVVKYDEIDPAIFELEINGAQKTAGLKTTGNITVGRARESSTIILSMLAISMLTTSFGLSASKEEFESQMVKFWHYCLKAAEDTGVVLWQFFNGTLRARKIVSKELTKPYAGRNVVLREYVNWRGSTNAQNSTVYKELNKEEEYIEVDEEQEKKIKEALLKESEPQEPEEEKE